MPITFRCEHCGKKVEAPDSAGGKRGRCPYCKQSNYIPAPVDEDEIIPLAPEEDDQTQRSAEAEAEDLRRQERELLAEMGGADATVVPLDQRDNLKPEDLHHLVVNYCLDLADSRLERAETHVRQLKKVRRMAVEAVNDFLSGKVKEPVLEKVPPKLLEGFLRQLREALA